MAIVVYRCNTCKREIEFVRNPRGLETLQKCTITHGCRGTLTQIKVYPDYQRASIPDDVIGLDNWSQRRIIYNHTQGVPSREWLIDHYLNGFPSVIVFIDRPTEDDPNNQEEITPEKITYLNPNSLLLTLDSEFSGVAQVIARSSNSSVGRTVQEEVQLFQATIGGELTIATSTAPVGSEPANPTNIAFQLRYATNEGYYIFNDYLVDNEPTYTSPWDDFTDVIIKGRVYRTRTFNFFNAEIASGGIKPGSLISITGIDKTYDVNNPPGTSGVYNYRPLRRNEIFLLLANSPYSNIDKITDKAFDLYYTQEASGAKYLVYNTIESGFELFITPSHPEQIYPQIRNTN
jgi:hypothetical protein